METGYSYLYSLSSMQFAGNAKKSSNSLPACFQNALLG